MKVGHHLKMKIPKYILIKMSKHAKTSDSSEPDDVEEPNESWNEVTCYCSKPFAGRPMVECSKCLTWLHLKCAGLRRNNIPDTWYCSKCKNSKKSDINITNTNSKTISGSRKRKSTKVIQQKSTSNSKKKSISSSDVDVDLPIAAAPSTSTISPITTITKTTTNTTVPSHNLALTSTTSNNTSKETSERRKS